MIFIAIARASGGSYFISRGSERRSWSPYFKTYRVHFLAGLPDTAALRNHVSIWMLIAAMHGNKTCCVNHRIITGNYVAIKSFARCTAVSQPRCNSLATLSAGNIPQLILITNFNRVSCRARARATRLCFIEETWRVVSDFLHGCVYRNKCDDGLVIIVMIMVAQHIEQIRITANMLMLHIHTSLFESFDINATFKSLERFMQFILRSLITLFSFLPRHLIIYY